MKTALRTDVQSTGKRPLASRPAGLALIFVVILLDLIGLSVLNPVAPYVVRQYSSDALAVSMLTMLYAAAQFVAAPILGKLSDRFEYILPPKWAACP